MTESAASIIEQNGGPSAFAEKVGKRPGAVRVWKHRNQFPREVWPEILTAFPDISLEKLMDMEARR